MVFIEENTETAIEELTLVLLYLTRFREHGYPEKTYRTWKGYDFDILNSLAEKGDIIDRKRSKSVYIDNRGCERAKELLNKYGIKDWEKQF